MLWLCGFCWSAGISHTALPGCTQRKCRLLLWIFMYLLNAVQFSCCLSRMTQWTEFSYCLDSLTGKLLDKTSLTGSFPTCSAWLLLGDAHLGWAEGISRCNKDTNLEVIENEGLCKKCDGASESSRFLPKITLRRHFKRFFIHWVVRLRAIRYV